MKATFVAVFFLFVTFCPFVFGEQTEIEKSIQEIKIIPRAEGKKSAAFSYGHDLSWVKQGAEKGYWKENNARLTMLGIESMTPYCEWSRQVRLDRTDSVMGVGSYFKTAKGFFHFQTGFNVGSRKYLYRFKGLFEYERNLFKTVNANFNARYLRYIDNDVYLVSPGLIYYFGNNYLSAAYGSSLTEGRDAAHFGSLQGSFSLTERWSALVGASVGERLYDILLLPSSKQYGYVTFLNVTFAASPAITFHTGFSYGKEQPSFIKRGVSFGVTIQF